MCHSLLSELFSVSHLHWVRNELSYMQVATKFCDRRVGAGAQAVFRSIIILGENKSSNCTKYWFQAKLILLSLEVHSMHIYAD